MTDARDRVAVVAEDRGADGVRGEAHGIDGERLERPDQAIELGEVELGDHEPGDDAVEEEVIPFDGGADGGGDDGAPRMHAVLAMRILRGRCCRHASVSRGYRLHRAPIVGRAEALQPPTTTTILAVNSHGLCTSIIGNTDSTTYSRVIRNPERAAARTPHAGFSPGARAESRTSPGR